MKKINSLAIIILLMITASCKKDATDSSNVTFTVDPNNYFTATFLGKTIRTDGFLSSNVDITQVTTIHVGAKISTGIQTSELSLIARGSQINASLGNVYKTPVQTCDADISLTKTGAALGNYTLSYFLGVDMNYLSDLSGASKRYTIDPTTVFTVTAVDTKYVTGTYTGKLVDGTTKIPVNGTFKLSK